MQNILISDIMTRDPIVVKPDTTLLDCTKKMVKKKIGNLLLVEKKRLMGIISRKDILWAIVKKTKEDLEKIRAIDISPKKIATIKPTATVAEALSKMKKFRFNTLPVIHEGELVGLVTIKDILNFNPELYPELDELAQIREETKKLKRIKKAKDREPISTGMCEECGNHDFLQKIDGRLICESCQNSI